MTRTTVSPSPDAAPLVGVPGLQLLKKATDPVLSATPDWLHAVLWAVIVMIVLYAVLLWLCRHALPWISKVLTPPLRVVIEFGGVALILPGYVASTLMRRTRAGVPGFLFAYDDLVHNGTRACHWTAAMFLRLLTGLRRTSRLALVVLLAVMVGLWDITYCAGAGEGCTIPTSQWIRQVSQAVDSPEPAPKPTPCPKKKHSKKCTPTHRSHG
jgi:hypothetical protein